MDSAQRDAYDVEVQALHGVFYLANFDQAVVRGCWVTLEHFKKQRDDDITKEKKKKGVVGHHPSLRS